MPVCNKGCWWAQGIFCYWITSNFFSLGQSLRAFSTYPF